MAINTPDNTKQPANRRVEIKKQINFFLYLIWYIDPHLMYSKTTKKINITVKPYYLEDQSEPEDQHYVWAYRVIIDNQGKDKVQLVSRYWKIIDANGILQEVRGKGVVGEQPVLQSR